jgi:hypothetical protein
LTGEKIKKGKRESTVAVVRATTANVVDNCRDDVTDVRRGYAICIPNRNESDVSVHHDDFVDGEVAADIILTCI